MIGAQRALRKDLQKLHAMNLFSDLQVRQNGISGFLYVSVFAGFEKSYVLGIKINRSYPSTLVSTLGGEIILSRYVIVCNLDI